MKTQTRFALMLCVVILSGCQKMAVSEPVWMDDGTQVQAALFSDTNILGHDTTSGFLQVNPKNGGPVERHTFSGVSDSILNEIGGTIVGATGLVLAADRLDADNTNINNSANGGAGGDGGRGGNAEAEIEDIQINPPARRDGC